jgi:capsular polysaccharide export protein
MPLTNTARERADNLIRRLKNARVGGSFWGGRPELAEGCTVWKPRPGDAAAFCPAAGNPIFLWADEDPAVRASGHLSGFLTGELDPWHLLDQVAQVVAPADDALAILARLLGVPVIDSATGKPLVHDLRARRSLAWQVLGAPIYREPFTGSEILPEAAIDLLGEWRRHLDKIGGIGVQFGMRGWKRSQIDRFLTGVSGAPRHARTTRAALQVAGTKQATVAIWPSRVPPEFEARAAASGVPVARVEDGFLRSSGLGVHLVPPQSIIVDREGIHYDPARPSDLERLLAEHRFPPELLCRAVALRTTIVSAGLGKYGRGGKPPAIVLPPDRRSILVIGQVADDRSVLMGDIAGGGNAGLLERARAHAPDAFLLYKPHPDVLSGHRRAGLRRETHHLADHVLNRPCDLAPLLKVVDEVHVLTSLAGFEALLRGCSVVCHGAPFYAGWGLTNDLVSVPRRKRRLTLDQLVAGALLLYPLYLDADTGLPCSAERLAACLVDAAPRPSLVNRLRLFEGLIRGALRPATA